jgi:hypothetical protein
MNKTDIFLQTGNRADLELNLDVVMPRPGLVPRARRTVSPIARRSSGMSSLGVARAFRPATEFGIEQKRAPRPILCLSQPGPVCQFARFRGLFLPENNDGMPDFIGRKRPVNNS